MRDTLVLLALSLVGGCSAGGWTPSRGSVAALSPSSGEANTPIGAPAPQQAPMLRKMVRVVDADFPDPCMLVDSNAYFAFATNTGGLNIPMRRSTNLTDWSPPQESLPTLPSWATQSMGFAWAPSVMKIGQGDYRMLFSAQHAVKKVQCLAVARANAAAGPYTNVGDAPLQCGLDVGGSLDASLFRTGDGQPWMVYKTNGPSHVSPQIFVQSLTPDGLAVAGGATGVLSLSLNFEGDVLEGPFVRVDGNHFFVTYSCNVFSTPNYATGVAVASSLAGPYIKASAPALATTGSSLIGPGGAEIFEGLDGYQYVSFHGWDSAALRYRAMYIAPVAQLVQNGNLPAGI